MGPPAALFINVSGMFVNATVGLVLHAHPLVAHYTFGSDSVQRRTSKCSALLTDSSGVSKHRYQQANDVSTTDIV
jgi:hypothetical protein